MSEVQKGEHVEKSEMYWVESDNPNNAWPEDIKKEMEVEGRDEIFKCTCGETKIRLYCVDEDSKPDEEMVAVCVGCGLEVTLSDVITAEHFA